MKRIFIIVVLLILGMLPAMLYAEVSGNNNNTQQVSQDAELAKFKTQLAKDTRLTDSQRDALLADRMKQMNMKAGKRVRPDRNLALSKNPGQAQNAAMGMQVRPPRATVQSARPQSKDDHKAVQAKANDAVGGSDRNVLVH